MLITKKKIVQVSRKWLGTPFHLHGRIKHEGCDCIGLILCVANELDLYSKLGVPIIQYDCFDYSIESGKLLYDFLECHLCKKEDFTIGDVLLFKINKVYFHCGIVADYRENQYSLIHACIRRKKVIEHRILNYLKNNILSCYAFM